MGKLLKGGLSGGLILFIWSTISWNVLGWNLTTFTALPNESATSEFMQQLPESGMYLLHLQQPLVINTEHTVGNMSQEAQIFASIRKESDPTNQILQLLTSLITQIIAALLVTGLILLKPHVRYTSRLFQVLLFATAAGVVSYLPYMNWFYFSLQHTFIAIMDLLIGWFLAGFAISHFTRPNYPRFY